MDTLEDNQDNCRICLEKPAFLEWNEEIHDSYGTTYKYCYYKYTQLDNNVLDNYSQMLCETCSYDLKRFHFLIQKALESHYILQQGLVTFAETTDTEEKIGIKEQIGDDEEFETVFFQKSAESLIEDYESKDLFPLCMVETSMDISKDLEEQVETNSKAKSYKDSKNIANNKKRKFNKYVKDGKEDNIMKFRKHDNFPGDSEGFIDIPPSPAIPEVAQDKVRDRSENKNNRKITCAYCPKILGAKYMKRHEETHKDRDRKEVCPKCGTKYFNKHSLSQHMMIHNENREKKHKCDFCDKAYYDRGALNIHRRIHLGQMIACPICSKEYFRQVDLDIHNARTHSVAVLGKAMAKKNKYLVECKDCGKNVSSNRWKHHQLLHSNKLQMKCTLCDKHFASKLSCHKHVRRVHKYTDDFAKVVIYYGDEVGKRCSLTMLKQAEVVKPML